MLNESSTPSRVRVGASDAWWAGAYEDSQVDLYHPFKGAAELDISAARDIETKERPFAGAVLRAAQVRPPRPLNAGLVPRNAATPIV